MKISTVLLVCLISIGLSAGQTIGQVGDVNLKPVLDGFNGEYLTGNQKLIIEYRVSNSKLSVSRIMNSSGQTIVEAVQVPGSVTVRVTDVTLTIYMNQTDPGTSKVSELSEGDRRKLQQFSRSDASAAVREVLASIIRQKALDGKDQLFGFLTIAMLLGDGPRAPFVQQSKVRCPPKLVFASYIIPNPQKAELSIFPTVGKSMMDDCNGCCGPACWGCTGCYTGACEAHDNCVTVWGAQSPTCIALLAGAVASMCSQCGIGCYLEFQ